jgi:hypothetical protein
MVTLLSLILEALGKHKRHILDSFEHTLPPPLFPPVRKKILRELGKDEFEKELERIIDEYERKHGKGK